VCTFIEYLKLSRGSLPLLCGSKPWKKAKGKRPLLFCWKGGYNSGLGSGVVGKLPPASHYSLLLLSCLHTWKLLDFATVIFTALLFRKVLILDPRDSDILLAQNISNFTPSRLRWSKMPVRSNISLKIYPLRLKRSLVFAFVCLQNIGRKILP